MLLPLYVDVRYVTLALRILTPHTRFSFGFFQERQSADKLPLLPFLIGGFGGAKSMLLFARKTQRLVIVVPRALCCSVVTVQQ